MWNFGDNCSAFGDGWKTQFFWVGHLDFFFKKKSFCLIPMKISHKLCVRMDGTQSLLLWWFTAKNERGNDKIAWVYLVESCCSNQIDTYYENALRSLLDYLWDRKPFQSPYLLAHLFVWKATAFLFWQ